MPASEPVQADTSPPCEIKVVREVGFLKSTGQLDQMGYRHSSSSGGEVLTSELTIFLGQSGKERRSLMTGVNP